MHWRMRMHIHFFLFSILSLYLSSVKQNISPETVVGSDHVGDLYIASVNIFSGCPSEMKRVSVAIAKAAPKDVPATLR
jgi:hypothetical protein